MLSKKEIEKAKETTQNYIKDTPIAPFDCLMNIERESAITLLQYTEQLENKIKEMEESKEVREAMELAGLKVTALVSLKHENEKLKADNYELNNRLNEYIEERQKLIDKMKSDRMEQFDDYVIYLIETYLKELGVLENE